MMDIKKGGIAVIFSSVTNPAVDFGRDVIETRLAARAYLDHT
jgi:hypothetical protein